MRRLRLPGSGSSAAGNRILSRERSKSDVEKSFLDPTLHIWGSARHCAKDVAPPHTQVVINRANGSKRLTDAAAVYKEVVNSAVSLQTARTAAMLNIVAGFVNATSTAYFAQPGTAIFDVQGE